MIVVSDTVISLLTAWFTCCLRLRLAQALRGMYRLSRNSLGLKDAEPGVTPLLQLLCTVRIICQAGCVQHKASSQTSDPFQPGRLAAWCFFVCFLSLAFNPKHVYVPHLKKGFKATLNSWQSVLLFPFPKVPPPISFSWKRLWLLSNSECEPKAGHALATPPSARISIDKVTCCSLTCALSLQTWEWSSALSAKSSIWCWHTVALWRDCQCTPGIKPIPWKRGGKSPMTSTSRR